MAQPMPARLRVRRGERTLPWLDPPPVVKLSKTQRRAVEAAIDVTLSPDAFQTVVEAIESCIANYWFHQRLIEEARSWWRVNPARQRRALKAMSWLRETSGIDGRDWNTMQSLETKLLACIRN